MSIPGSTNMTSSLRKGQFLTSWRRKVDFNIRWSRYVFRTVMIFFSFCYLYISNLLLTWWKCIDVIIQILVRHSGQIFVRVGLVFKSKRWKYHPTLAQIMFNDIIICILIGTHGELCRYIKTTLRHVIYLHISFHWVYFALPNGSQLLDVDTTHGSLLPQETEGRHMVCRGLWEARVGLTHCGPVTPFSDIELCQHWLR